MLVIFTVQCSLLNTAVDITFKKVFDNVPLQNAVLISASESGDVMTVVSLLKNGADVQTEDEVYIFFSYILVLILHHAN